MPKVTLKNIYRYPVKSLRGEDLSQSGLDEKGLEFDRHWMLVDQEGMFLSQRKVTRMALVQARVSGGRLTLQAEGMSDLHLSPTSHTDKRIAVQVWGDECLAAHAGLEASSWLSEFLETECDLVYMPGDQTRQVDLDYSRLGDQTAFSDGFPLLVISESSLDDLNSRLSESLPMERFRPNLVVAGCEPYAEDTWRRIRIGNTEFRVVKPCSRCIITTVDPATSKTGPEPLKTLSGYRRVGNRVYFGQNLIHEGTGQVSIGMDVEVLEQTKSNVF